MTSHNGAAEELVEKGFTFEDACLMVYPLFSRLPLAWLCCDT